MICGRADTLTPGSAVRPTADCANEPRNTEKTVHSSQRLYPVLATAIFECFDFLLTCDKAQDVRYVIPS